MKKYLGSRMNVYAAIVMPLFIVAPLIFAAVVFTSEISFATFFIAFLCFFCSVISLRNLAQHSLQLYSWGRFDDEGIHISSWFHSKNTMYYSKCKSCGIAYYTHGVLNTGFGGKEYYIFFDYDIFDETYRTNVNLWKPSATRIKVGFDAELYSYLLTVLSKKQALLLQRDFEKIYKK